MAGKEVLAPSPEFRGLRAWEEHGILLYMGLSTDSLGFLRVHDWILRVSIPGEHQKAVSSSIYFILFFETEFRSFAFVTQAGVQWSNLGSLQPLLPRFK